MCILMTTVTPRLKNDSILEIICLYSLQCSHHMIIVDKTDESEKTSWFKQRILKIFPEEVG